MIYGVYLCSPYNSQIFTECCHVAICPDENYCPKCNNEVIHGDNKAMTDRIRWRYAYKK